MGRRSPVTKGSLAIQAHQDLALAPSRLPGLHYMCERQTQLCYLCGRCQATTRDHVFPRLLFPKGKSPTKLRTLPACFRCNNELSKDEELFQQLLLSRRALDTDAAREVWDTKVRPNLNNSKPRLRQSVLTTSNFARPSLCMGWYCRIGLFST